MRGKRRVSAEARAKVMISSMTRQLSARIFGPAGSYRRILEWLPPLMVNELLRCIQDLLGHFFIILFLFHSREVHYGLIEISSIGNRASHPKRFGRNITTPGRYARVMVITSATIEKGITALQILEKSIPETLDVTNSVIPTGGVTRPMVIIKQ